jgi:hypothetical protein
VTQESKEITSTGNLGVRRGTDQQRRNVGVTQHFQMLPNTTAEVYFGPQCSKIFICVVQIKPVRDAASRM